MRDVLMLHAQKYPAMKAEDGVKLCYQSEFGGGHLLPSREVCEESIRDERSSAPSLGPEASLLENISGGLFRLHLNAPEAQKLRTQTIAGLFLAASEKKRGSLEGFLATISLLKELCKTGRMPFSSVALKEFLDGYEKAGYPLCRHSETYRSMYHPAYRLMEARAEKYLPLLFELDKRLGDGKPVTIAIDGPSGAGKSSLAAFLKMVYGDCEVFHMDDFFLPPDKKTDGRLNTPGGNVDWERVLQEVLVPLQMGQPFAFRPYDCGTCALGVPVQAIPRRLNIVEGVYSHHPALRSVYDLTVFLGIGKKEQSERILIRNGERMHQRFLTEWIPMEDLYFKEMRIQEDADLILK